ncbi:CDP-alcohol phosphatidyltransferase family protein [Cereibacter sediminicola]|uniref:CDP-alcohol phosphatidyltransferase family protein n=1 Tax=Cereibacter sediminicola TaxID=2584941 RepID=UPI00119CC1BD|nr:CDP-alcohol phosphatidyltransferase family protein [Cereibacter sediminicola]
MLDGLMRRLIDPPLDRAGRALARRGWSADMVTLAGLGLGLLAAGIVALGLPPVWAIVPLLAGRIADGLDGAIARATRRTDFGGYLDITCDFLFYAAFPLAFVLRDPEVGAAGAFLLASFYVNGATFLGFAVLAARRGMETRARGEKSLYFTAGLLEGSETILFFLFLCLFPQLFAPAAWIFGTLCFVTAASRVLLALRLFRE